VTETPDDQQWSRTCPTCGTELAQATVDMNPDKLDRPEMRPGEMASVDFCPNKDCPSHRADLV
jgi:hypothetical protein